MSYNFVVTFFAYSPNISDISLTAISRLLFLPAFFSMLSSFRSIDFLTSSCPSKSLSSKKSMGFKSNLAPIPYNAAATCLHMLAQSGQLQSKCISLGDGNIPYFFSVNKTSNSFGNFPSINCSKESILLLHSAVTWSHFLLPNASIPILIS